MAIHLIFFFRIQRLIFKAKTYFYSINTDPIFDLYLPWALFTGTKGPNNKFIFYVNGMDKSEFVKVARTQQASENLQNEARAIERLFYYQPQYFNIPNITLKNNNTLYQSDLSNEGKRINYLTPIHFNALLEMNDLTSTQIKLKGLNSWSVLKTDLEQLSTNEDNRIPKGMLRKLTELVKRIDENSEIEISLCHGDFTPWNMYVNKDKLSIYDWELSKPFMPLGYDAFHFIIQQGVLVDHKNWKQIKQDIENYLTLDSFKSISKFGYRNVDEYLQLYLIFNTVQQLKIFSNQLSWHTQVNWLLNVWNDAITTCFSTVKKQRELVIMDLFDHLLDKNYATIKFPCILPENLSEYSDIDMFIEKGLNKTTLNFLNNHPLVNHVSVKNTSFMSTQQVICNDGTIISLDLIWQMKRKNMELLNAQKVLQKATLNSYGIKMLDIYDNIRYIGLFYLSNKAGIPSKFTAYEEMLNRSTHELDSMLYNYFIEEDLNRKPILNYIEKQKSNKGFNWVLNSINYLLDTARNVINSKGMIITFSGVDGAGKSTVIDKLKFKLEKQLRRRVVVLRHRPSLLPIISSFTKGKARAEKDAAENLPRMGTNKSFISSLFRFSYYYTDYFFGQFIIYIKYITRGYIVLYDRYYFDFINDSKRSNIQLPRSLMKFGLKFLLKPRFNFFLYAKPEIILERKKELTKETIETLTSDYIKLFRSLDTKNGASRYNAIENTELENTLNNIFSSISKHAA